jgi:hypothetical protein
MPTPCVPSTPRSVQAKQGEEGRQYVKKKALPRGFQSNED